jgi:hypothetical protein
VHYSFLHPSLAIVGDVCIYFTVRFFIIMQVAESLRWKNQMFHQGRCVEVFMSGELVDLNLNTLQM